MKVYALDHVITTGGGCTAQGPCVYEDICPTLKSVPHGVAMIKESDKKQEEDVRIVMVFDARGNGQGGISPTLSGDHQDRITDYTAIVVEKE